MVLVVESESETVENESRDDIEMEEVKVGHQESCAGDSS